VVIERYDPRRKDEWDGFVRQSKNGTFLFFRDYMDYHADRFEDCSALIRNDRGSLLALLPAHCAGDLLASHGGLTYGGFIVNDDMKTAKMLRVFDAVLTYAKTAGFKRLLYKSIPHLYHQVPAEEDRYALFLCGATVVRRAVLSVVMGARRVPFQERRLRGLKQAKAANLTVVPSDQYDRFWPILIDRLWQTHHTRPVHRLDEIQLLHSRFPQHIRLFGCFADGEMVAGVVVYETNRVAHTQYIAASDRGREMGALDAVFTYLLFDVYAGKPFDFGTADEDDGRCLNHGLLDHKEGFGARAVVHDHYEIDLVAWQPGALRAVADARS
jgi:hypothetical protein